MSLGELTDATVRYLYAMTWLPESDGDYSVAVPGGSVRAVDAAGNLLHIAMWSLRHQGLMEFEQLRPADEERVRVLGGEPFSAFELRDTAATRPGLDGALPQAARQATGGDVRALVRALDLYLAAEPELTGAVMSDCLRTVADAYSPDLGD